MNAGTVLGTNVGYNTLSVGFKIMELLSINFVNHTALHQGEYGTRSVLFPCQQQMGAAGRGGRNFLSPRKVHSEIAHF